MALQMYFFLQLISNKRKQSRENGIQALQACLAFFSEEKKGGITSSVSFAMQEPTKAGNMGTLSKFLDLNVI